MLNVSEMMAAEQRQKAIRAYQRAIAALDELREAINGFSACPRDKRVDQSQDVNQAMVFVRRAMNQIGIPRPRDQSPAAREEFMQQCHTVYRSRNGA